MRDLAYGPESLKIMGEAFDQAWEAIRPIVDDNPLSHEAARLKLANMILSVARSRALEGIARQVAPADPADTATTS